MTLDEIRALHVETEDAVCAHDSQPWPCHDAVLLAAVDVLRDDIAKLQAWLEADDVVES